MSDFDFKIGQSVELLHRNLTGRVAFVGQTSFSPGKWVGVILDQERGKNNGTVKGACYFKCDPNRGLFVRPTQLRALREQDTDSFSATPKVPKTPSLPSSPSSQPSPAALLKATNISLPKKAKQVVCSSSQLALNASPSPPAISVMAVRSATSSVLAIPAKIRKSTLSPASSFCSVKRASASFVETGFLEILMPRFTPGPPLRSPSVNAVQSTGEDATSEIKQLKEQVAVLVFNLEEEKQQRLNDKRQLNELHRIKLSNEKLQEFKVKIMQQHGALQRELQRSRQETRELNEAKDRYVRELAELNETLELLTLDKEMAEEKCETLQLELDMAKEQNDELLLDIDILRAELESNSAVDNRSNEELRVGVMQVKKLEQLNQRLKQTVISLRDMLSQDKLDLQKATKELDTKHSEITELVKTKEILSRRIDIMEIQIIDLKEQVDAALGADTMVETLVERKLELEERVQLLEEEVSELEALAEIHEQIIEGNQELELDLREEVALLNKTINSLQQKENTALEMLYERDTTIKKFRELVKVQNEKIQAAEPMLPDEDHTVTIEDGEDAPQLDYRQLFSLTKAGGREIDALLNALDLKLCQMQADLLLAYMPEEFLSRGGDYDIIKLIISFHRMDNKGIIISNIINEKFPSGYDFDRDAVFESFSLHRFAFRSKYLYFLSALRLMLQQIIACVQNSDHKLCLQTLAYSDEILRHEGTFDEILKLLKNNEIDENSSTEGIERAHSFLTNLHTNLMSEQLRCDMVDEQQLYLALAQTYELAIDCLAVNAELMERLLELDDESAASFYLMKLVADKMAEFKKRLKTFRLKMPDRHFINFNGLNHGQLQAIKVTNETVGKLINILSVSCKEALKSAASRKSDDACAFAIDHNRLWQILTLNCFKFRPEIEGGPSVIVHGTIKLLDEQIKEIFNFISEQQNANIFNRNTVYVRSSAHALNSRAAEVKKKYEQVKQLTANLEAREKEVKALKYIVKMKQTEYSEMQIRKEFAERNVNKLVADQVFSMNTILTYTESVLHDCTIREHYLISSMDKLEGKILLLEETATKYRRYQQEQQEQQQQQQRQQQLGVVLGLPTYKSVSNYFHMDIMDLDLFANCLRREHKIRRRQQADHWRTTLRHLEPINVPQKNADVILSQLEKESRRIKNDWIITHIALRGDTLAQGKANIFARSNLCSAKVLEEYLKRNPQKSVQSTFRAFPSFQLMTNSSK